MKYRIALLLFLILYLSQPLFAFIQSAALSRPRQIDFTRARKLETAGSELIGFIPRLEPGLRLLHSTQLNFLKANSIQNFHFPLSLLAQEAYEEVQQQQTTSTTTTTLPAGKLNLDALFARVQTSVKTFSQQFLNFMGKVATVALFLIGNWNTPAVIASENLHRAAIATGSAIVATVTNPRQVHASILQKYRKLQPIQKLATTPLYFISNSRGNAYLQDDAQSGNEHQKVVTYYMSYEEAQESLNEMAQQNPQSANDIRITTISMEKVINQMQAKKQSRKYGRYEMDLITKIQPVAQQYKNAEKIAMKGHAGMKGVAIPMFSAQGLAIKRANNEVVTPYYFVYEDLLEDWNNMVAKNPNANYPATPKVIVSDVTDVLCLSKGITNELLTGQGRVVAEDTAESMLTASQVKQAMQTPGIVPPRNEIMNIKKYYRNQAVPGVAAGEYSRAKLTARP